MPALFEKIFGSKAGKRVESSEMIDRRRRQAQAANADGQSIRSESDVVASLADVTVEFEETYSSKKTQVFNNLSINVHDGEFLGIVGRSGCGKTTVLNVLVGFVSPSRGHVTVLGQSPRQARDRVGYMFAHDALLPWRSALGSVELGLELKGMSKKKRREVSRKRLASLGLGDKDHLFPSQLSKGMRQRVALARTWVTNPELLLMDEPFGALDAQTRGSVQREFLDMWEEKQQTVVFVTHDLTEAIIMADRILVMGSRGNIRDEVTVPFSRPRNLVEMSGLPEYQQLLRRLTDAIGADDEDD